jgi:hypothetical protein
MSRKQTLHLLPLLPLVACTGVTDERHLEQALVVENAVFHEGSLTSSDAAEATVTSLSFSLGSVTAGAHDVPVSGRASSDAYAIAFALDDRGSGYWTRKVGTEDPSFPGELAFDALLQIGTNITPGLTTLSVRAIDGNGRPGPAEELSLCVLPDIPDHGNACDPKVEPPRAVVSLAWDSDADLDLTVVSPSGKVYNRSRRGVANNAGKVLASFDRDSSAGCQQDGKRRESFVVESVPERGPWKVYAGLFDACGAASARYELDLYEREETEEGRYALTRKSRTHGVLLRSQADGGGKPPFYITSVSL